MARCGAGQLQMGWVPLLLKLVPLLLILVPLLLASSRILSTVLCTYMGGAAWGVHYKCIIMGGGVAGICIACVPTTGSIGSPTRANIAGRLLCVFHRGGAGGQVYRPLSRTFRTIENFEVELLMFKSRDEAD